MLIDAKICQRQAGLDEGAAPNGADPEKRERILNAAVKVFAERGFFNSRVADVAREAQVADGTIYLYFKNKDDLLISLFEDRMEEILNRFREAVATSDDPREQLHALIQAHGTMVAENPELAQVIQVELRQSAQFMKEYTPVKFGELLQMIEDIFHRGVETGIFKDSIHPGAAKRAVFGAMDEIALHWVVGEYDYDISQTYEQLADLLLGGLCRSDSGTP